MVWVDLLQAVLLSYYASALGMQGRFKDQSVGVKAVGLGALLAASLLVQRFWQDVLVAKVFAACALRAGPSSH